MKHKSILFGTFTMFVMILFLSCSSHNEITPDTDSTKLWPAYSNNKWGYINNKGVFEIPAQFDEVSSFSCGYALVTINSKQFFINKSGKFQTTPAFDEVSDFYNNYATVRLSGKYGLMNRSFEYAVPPMYYYLGYATANGLVAAKLSSNSKVGFINTSGENKIAALYDYAYFADGYGHVTIDGNSGIINKVGEYLIQPIWKGENNLTPIGNSRFRYYDEDNRKYGLLNENGLLVVQPLYEFIDGSPLYPWTLIPVRRDDKYGYMDKDGNEKILCQYDEADLFVEGYAYVRLDNKNMIIDQSGNIVLMLAEEERPVTYMHNGLILTRNSKDNTYYYKDIKGSVIYTWSTSGSSYYAPGRTETQEGLSDPRIFHLGN